MNDQYWSIVRPNRNEKIDTSDIPEAGEDWFKKAKVKLPTAETKLSQVTVEAAPGRWDVKVAGITVGTYDSKAEAEAEKRRYERDIEAEKAHDVTR